MLGICQVNGFRQPVKLKVSVMLDEPSPRRALYTTASKSFAYRYSLCYRLPRIKLWY
ncbi:hypothetical protein DSO57_1025528 [Entomophthora muscae]|uniref:Uncharacterized protein n=1 Tax=Entomophthora muscae TaxID=34485 RepID=A0ACC2SR80_9FUNG|nr:hypothetical protein DSO57_1025528 [Entomophthora muscae]